MSTKYEPKPMPASRGSFKSERCARISVTPPAPWEIIHPAQVEPVQTAFTPNDEAVAYAKRIVETFEANQKEGKGAYSLDGKMIDMPLVKNAQKVLERAKAAGKN